MAAAESYPDDLKYHKEHDWARIEDDEAVLTTAEEITSEFPAIKVIACSSEEPVMRVFPPFHHGESYASKLSAALLALALSS